MSNTNTTEIQPDGAAEERPWHEAFPAPQAEARPINASAVLDLLKSSDGAKPSFVLVDVRRTDYEGGTVQGSINLPAQSLYPTLPSLYTLFKAAGVQQVIFYCNSSRGRGPRSAAWFADYLRDQNDCDIESLVLAGGIKGWVAGGKDYTKYVQNFEPSMWK